MVVLLCQRKEPHLLRDGWELAAVVTYAEILLELKTRIAAERRWRRDHSDQHSFIRQMFEHFVEGPSAMNLEDTIGFLTKMCETGESARYGHRPRDVATQEFVDLIAEHARRQLEDSRTVLATTKRRLREYSRSTLVGQVNAKIPHGPIERVVTRFVGQWEWTIELHRADEHRTVFFHFGPTSACGTRCLTPSRRDDRSSLTRPATPQPTSHRLLTRCSNGRPSSPPRSVAAPPSLHASPTIIARQLLPPWAFLGHPFLLDRTAGDRRTDGRSKNAEPPHISNSVSSAPAAPWANSVWRRTEYLS